MQRVCFKRKVKKVDKKNPRRSGEKGAPMQWAVEIQEEMGRFGISCEELAEELKMKPQHVRSILLRDYPCPKMEKRFRIALRMAEYRRNVIVVYPDQRLDLPMDGGGGG